MLPSTHLTAPGEARRTAATALGHVSIARKNIAKTVQEILLFLQPPVYLSVDALELNSRLWQLICLEYVLG